MENVFQQLKFFVYYYLNEDGMYEEQMKAILIFTFEVLKGIQRTEDGNLFTEYSHFFKNLEFIN